MKLAEALLERKELVSKMNRLNESLKQCSVVKKDGYNENNTATAVNLEEVSKQLDDCFNEYEDLLVRINLTNLKTLLDGESLTKLMVRRENLRREVEFRKMLWKNLFSGTYLSPGETLQIEGYDLYNEEQKCSKQLRLLNERIQWANWNTELL